MDVIFGDATTIVVNTNQAVIVAFIFTFVAISVATMFLSCFGKKKDKKKGNRKGNKSKSPSPQPEPRSSDEDTARIAVAAVDSEPSPEITVDAGNDGLGDFSAVQRETEILRSELNDESSLQLSFTSQASIPDVADNSEPVPEVKATTTKEDIAKPPSPSPDEQKTSKARSSMLDDIELTLANLGTEAKKEVTQVQTKVTTTLQETERKVSSVTKTAEDDVTREKVEIVEEISQKEAASAALFAAPSLVLPADKTVKKESEEKVVPSITLDSLSAGLKETKTDIETKTVTSLTEVKEEVEKKTVTTVNTEISTKLDDIKVEIENKARTSFNSITKESSDKTETTADKESGKDTKTENFLDKASGEIKDRVTTVVEEVKETVKDKFESITGGAGNEVKENGDTSNEGVKVMENVPKVNGTLNDLEKASSMLRDVGSPVQPFSPKVEVKIPPKVSPKPSPKMMPRPLLTKSEAIQDTVSKKEETSSPIEPNETPASPTTPTSPTQTKQQSRIPMSKKTSASAIPKLSFSTSKSSSVSPISSPDSSLAKKVGQTIQKEEEDIIEKVKEVAEETVENFQQSNGESHARDSKEKSPEPDKNSPFDRDNRGSKSRLTKLRYSGRKSQSSQSAESKSDESGSERGSRASSEAKSEDGKKMAVSEDASEADKSSRIPVRGGSKPRSSPPKTLGD